MMLSNTAAFFKTAVKALLSDPKIAFKPYRELKKIIEDTPTEAQQYDQSQRITVSNPMGEVE